MSDDDLIARLVRPLVWRQAALDAWYAEAYRITEEDDGWRLTRFGAAAPLAFCSSFDAAKAAAWDDRLALLAAALNAALVAERDAARAEADALAEKAHAAGFRAGIEAAAKVADTWGFAGRVIGNEIRKIKEGGT